MILFEKKGPIFRDNICLYPAIVDVKKFLKVRMKFKKCKNHSTTKVIFFVGLTLFPLTSSIYTFYLESKTSSIDNDMWSREVLKFML